MRTTTFFLAFLLSLGAVAQQAKDPLVYPNPAGDEMFVRVSNEVAFVVIQDLLGSEFARHKRQQNDESKTFLVVLPADQFPSGIYVVSLRTADNRIIDCEPFRIVK